MTNIIILNFDCLGQIPENSANSIEIFDLIFYSSSHHSKMFAPKLMNLKVNFDPEKFLDSSHENFTFSISKLNSKETYT